MHSILLKNKQIALKEELEKKHTITSLALNSIKHIVNQQHKHKTDQESNSDNIPHTPSPVLFHFWTNKILIILVFTVSTLLFVCWPRTEIPDIASIQQQISDLKQELQTQQILISALRRDLTSGLRELTTDRSSYCSCATQQTT